MESHRSGSRAEIFVGEIPAVDIVLVGEDMAVKRLMQRCDASCRHLGVIRHVPALDTCDGERVHSL